MIINFIHRLKLLCLSREGIAKYMEKKYFNDEVKTQVDFPVTSDKRMDIFYEIPLI